MVVKVSQAYRFSLGGVITLADIYEKISESVFALLREFLCVEGKKQTSPLKPLNWRGVLLLLVGRF